MQSPPRFPHPFPPHLIAPAELHQQLPRTDIRPRIGAPANRLPPLHTISFNICKSNAYGLHNYGQHLIYVQIDDAARSDMMGMDSEHR
jgi:hypothetical protein